MRRRRFLAALTAGLGTLAGCSDPGPRPTTTTTDGRPTGSPPTTATTREGTETETRTDTETETTVLEDATNVVEEGADPNGETAVDDVVEPLVTDGATLYFPEGTYLVDGLSPENVSNLTLYGEDGTTLKPPDDISNDNWIYFKEMSGFQFESFTLDNTATDVNPAHLFNVTGGTNRIKDVTVSGYREDREHCLRPWCEGSDTTLTLKNVRLPDGNTDGAAVYVPSYSQFNTNQDPGELVFEDCYVENFSQGVYASGHGGPLRFTGGEYANCGIAQIRVGGAHNETVVEDVTIRVDKPASPIDEKPNMRGIWVREGSNTTIDNCDIRYGDLSGSYSGGAIMVHFYQGSTTIKNTDIEVSDTVPALVVQSPTDVSISSVPAPSIETEPDSWDVTVENVTVTGDATKKSAMIVKGRDGNSLTDCCITQSGKQRNGMSFSYLTDNAVTNATIDVSGTPIVEDNATVSTSNVSENGSCSASTTTTGTTTQ